MANHFYQEAELLFVVEIDTYDVDVGGVAWFWPEAEKSSRRVSAAHNRLLIIGQDLGPVLGPILYHLFSTFKY